MAGEGFARFRPCLQKGETTCVDCDVKQGVKFHLMSTRRG